MSEILPKPCAPPTAPVKVILPEPVVTVSALVAKATELTVEVNISAPFATLFTFVLMLTLLLSVTGPVKVCAPDVYTLPLKDIPLEEVALKPTKAVVAPTVPPNVIEPLPEAILKLVPVIVPAVIA